MNDRFASDAHYRAWQPLFGPEHLVRGDLLVVAPHPDDEVIGPGGLVAAHAAAGRAVTCAIMTDGAEGVPGGAPDPDYVARRRAESEAASRALGGGRLVFLDFPDGGLASALRDAAAAPVRRLRDLLAAHDFETVTFPSPFEVHPDHRAACLAVLAAVRNGAGRTPRLLAYEVGEFMPCNLLLNTTDLFARKAEALAAFATQIEHHDLLGKVEARDRARCVNCDDPLVTHCEAYLEIAPAEIDRFSERVDGVLALLDAMMPPVPKPGDAAP